MVRTQTDDGLRSRATLGITTSAIVERVGAAQRVEFNSRIMGSNGCGFASARRSSKVGPSGLTGCEREAFLVTSSRLSPQVAEHLSCTEKLRPWRSGDRALRYARDAHRVRAGVSFEPFS